MVLKLFGHDPSPYVRRVRVLFAELGIPFERDARGWMADPAPELAAESPIGRLPMLDRGPRARERYVYDSRVIAEVLYEAQGGVTAPTDDAPHIQPTLWRGSLEDEDRNVVSTADAALDSAINLYLLEREGVKRDAVPYLQRQQQRVEACLAWLDRRYEGKITLSPTHMAFADITVVCAIDWLRFRQRADIDAHPHLTAMQKVHARRASFASTAPG
ncbi:MAG: gst [Labilithrix sp.]|nr:gst [Labilithrix sp.]